MHLIIIWPNTCPRLEKMDLRFGVMFLWGLAVMVEEGKTDDDGQLNEGTSHVSSYWMIK